MHPAGGVSPTAGATDRGIAIGRNAAKLAHLCDLGRLDSIERHTRAGLPVHIEPASGEGLTLRF